MPATELRVEVLTRDKGCLVTPGEPPEVIQAVSVRVWIGTRSRDHVVVQAANEPFNLAAGHDAINPLFPAAIVSLVVRDTQGDATLSCRRDDENSVLEAAAAAAALKRKWGWDESEPICISIGSIRFECVVELANDGGCLVKVQAVASWGGPVKSDL